MKIPIKTYNVLLKELNYIWNRPGDCSDFARVLNSGDNKKTYDKFGIKIFRKVIPLSQSAMSFTDKMNDASKTEFVWRIGQTALLLRSLEEKEAILFTYKAVDKVIEMKSGDDDIKCKKGCSFCCYQQVLINEAEGRFLTEYLIAHPELIDPEQLNRHRLWPHHSMRELSRPDDSEGWNSPKIEDKRCPALSPKGLCNIYEVRPLACRIHQAISDPALCDPRRRAMVCSPNYAQNAALVSAWMQFSDILPLAHGISLPTAR